MVSAFYVVLSALWLIKLSIDITRLRNQYRVAFGDGGFYELQTAIRVHGNAVEYIPIAMLLLIMMEMNGAGTWLVHVCGLMLFIGRVIHYYAMHGRDPSWRRFSISATYTTLLLMIFANLYYFSWADLIHLP